MIGFRVHIRFDDGSVLRQEEAASRRSLGHAGAAIRLTARRSIRRRKGPSAPGQPPHTRKGQLKRAILYAVDPHEESVVIGPQVDGVGLSGSAHEHGGDYRGDAYPRRPFMGPALQKNLSKLPKHWANSIRG